MTQTHVFAALVLAGCFFAREAGAAPITVIGHINDASNLDTDRNGTGNTTFEALSGNGRILAGGGGSGHFSGIFYFQLPAIPSGEKLFTSNLGLTVNNDFDSQVGQAIDVYGLGYLTGTPSTTLPNSWFYLGANDTRTGTVLGTNITDPITKISNDFVLGGTAIPSGTLFETNTSEDVVLTNYLTSLYDNGAVAGDFAIIRVSMDVNPGGNFRIDFASRDNGNASYRPFLQFDIQEVQPIPEPGTFALLALGFVGLQIRSRKR